MPIDRARAIDDRRGRRPRAVTVLEGDPGWCFVGAEGDVDGGRRAATRIDTGPDTTSLSLHAERIDTADMSTAATNRVDMCGRERMWVLVIWVVPGKCEPPAIWSCTNRGSPFEHSCCGGGFPRMALTFRDRLWQSAREVVERRAARRRVAPRAGGRAGGALRRPLHAAAIQPRRRRRARAGGGERAARARRKCGRARDLEPRVRARRSRRAQERARLARERGGDLSEAGRALEPVARLALRAPPAHGDAPRDERDGCGRRLYHPADRGASARRRRDLSGRESSRPRSAPRSTPSPPH